MAIVIALDFTGAERADFWLSAGMRPGVRECWIPRDQRRYGWRNYRGASVPAHRLAYAMAYGVDPGALMVLHSRDEKRCLNPRHLRLGTNRDNAADIAVAKLMDRIARARTLPALIRAARPTRKYRGG